MIEILNKNRMVLVMVVLLMLLVIPVAGQSGPLESSGSHPPMEQTEPTLEVIPPIPPIPQTDDNNGTLLFVTALVIVSFILAVADVIKTRSLANGYGKFIDALVNNTKLTDALEAEYRKLPPERRLFIDGGLDAIKFLVKLTPSTRDDVLAAWADMLRDGGPNLTFEEVANTVYGKGGDGRDALDGLGASSL